MVEYQLMGMDANKINSQLAVIHAVRVDVHHELPSTSLVLSSSSEQYRADQPWLVVADLQTAGVGRRGKVWQSNAGDISFSLLNHFACSAQNLGGLSLIAGISVSSVLKEMLGLKCQLKWPNDVIVNNAKLSGLLIEVKTISAADNYTITGIGINYRKMDTKAYDQPVTSLLDLCPNVPSREEIIAQIVNRLCENYHEFTNTGLDGFIDDYKSIDYLYDKSVKVIQGNNEHQGIAKGISQQGELLVKVGHELKTFNSGEVSVRKC